MSPAKHSDAFRGSVELLVLRALSLESMHGWGIAQRLRQISGGHFEVNQGTLYPALQRLEARGQVTSEWRTSEHNRRARYYEITKSGRRALAKERASWRSFVKAMELTLRTS